MYFKFLLIFKYFNLILNIYIYSYIPIETLSLSVLTYELIVSAESRNGFVGIYIYIYSYIPIETLSLSVLTDELIVSAESRNGFVGT